MSHFISHIATVEIPVTNLEASIIFYTDILGVKIYFKGEKEAMLTFEEKGVPSLYLVQTVSAETLSFKNTNNGIQHSVIDFYTADLKSFYHWLIEKNVEVGSLNMDAESGIGGFGFKDLDGNSFGATNVLQK
ncbi:VOC family protein [Saliterribacillus persicus]|uniref:Catechol 2,3-dioxygenase-like lactoylglutathione lyase family enzyme n=1 Tax=Saliterribacillus persicus TaxID=930114 RepID=A0A368X3J3_9BACI|nr:VOC family protein [Saliterribacillus persicus]RCW62570.1 catechol 2,3-dioxygenase-like lactoylglutathione lyase family enzyme [Saliterribacillus persicus]